MAEIVWVPVGKTMLESAAVPEAEVAVPTGAGPS